MNDANDAVITCRQVRKVYHDGSRELVILDAIDLDVIEGKILAISGPSGVGKSTLLHIMGTLDNPSAGEVLFRGESLQNMGGTRINHIRNQDIGFVFQFYHLLPEFTALENVMMAAINKGKRKRDCLERAEQLLEQVGLGDRGVTNETVSKLSGVYDTSFACQVQEKNNRMSGYMHYTGGRGGVAYVVGSLKFKYLFP